MLFVAAIIALFQAREARRLRLKQQRPFVTIDVDSVGAAELFLYVKNIGTSLARAITINIGRCQSAVACIPSDYSDLRGTASDRWVGGR
jgi:hypothetical protein